MDVGVVKGLKRSEQQQEVFRYVEAAAINKKEAAVAALRCRVRPDVFCKTPW